MKIRSAILAAACCGAVLPVAAVAETAPSRAGDLVIDDPAGDANAINDQGSERLVGNVAEPRASAPEADLLRIRLAPLREQGRVTGWSVAFRAAGPIGPHAATGQDLNYGIVAQPNSRCRFLIDFTTDVAGRGTARYADSGGCGGGPTTVALPLTVDGTYVRVDVPYRLLPPALRPGAVLPDVSAWTRIAPDALAPVGELDNVLRGRHAYRLPDAG